MGVMGVMGMLRTTIIRGRPAGNRPAVPRRSSLEGMIFRDRRDAGRLLAEAVEASEAVKNLAGGDLLVLAIPRGGVVLGVEVARRLGVPLDVWLARKIGAPGNPEFAIGSVSVNGEVMLDRATIAMLHISEAYIARETARQSEELARRMSAYRGHSEPVDVRGKRVVLVDDGIATGATALSALASLRRAGTSLLLLAAPVAPADALASLQAAADEAIVLHSPREFSAVGQFYEQFEAVSDEEVVECLRAAGTGTKGT